LNINVDAKDIRDTIKGFPLKAIMLIISFVTALLMFLPDAVLQKLFLLELRNRIGTYIGIIFLVSVCISVYLFVSSIIRNKIITNELSGKKARIKLSTLTQEEKRILLYMYNNRTETFMFPCTNSAILHLYNLLMISYASNLGQFVGSVQFMPFFLQQWTINAIDNNFDLFKNISDELPDDISKYMELL